MYCLWVFWDHGQRTHTVIQKVEKETCKLMSLIGKAIPMNMHRTKTIAFALALSLGSMVGVNDQLNAAESADGLGAVLKVGQARTGAAQKSQVKIDALSDQTRDRLQEYKRLMKLVEDLRVYNKKLDIQIGRQNERQATLEKSISEVTVIQRQITPLLIRMIDGLEQFVGLDVPFHLKERQDRIQFLRNNLDRPELTVAEKFRQVLEAYKIENEYGRKVDTYKDTIQINGADREVNMFRVGRIALLYQTSDTENSGVWDQRSRTWVELDSAQYRNAILKGVRIAKKQASIDILTLPIAAPEAVK